FLLASHARQSSSLLATLGNTLLEQGRLEEALAAAEQGLRQLEDLRDNDDALRLLEICDEACSRMSLHDRALEFATQWFALRRTRSRQLWLELTMFAERLLESGKLERALETVSEAVDLLAAEDETLPYGGQAHPLTLLADIHRALGDTAKAATAMREAVRAYRGLIADGRPWWSTGELAETLLSLAGDLEELGNPEALDHILEAIDIFEQVDASPGKYPANLTNALNRLGDYAATRSMYELATTAYARVLILAEPFPARTSEPVLEIERRLDATCRESGTGLDDALARGRQPITART
ncbi:MAG TPA: hypothetical protein VK034_18245, partial [Enhygromyxa sp.]|nr:hypothetical protein [Enhygromyxa sp.]